MKSPKRNIGESHQSQIIIGLIPSGTVMEVVDLVYHHHIEMGDSYFFRLRPRGPLGDEWPRLDANRIEEDTSAAGGAYTGPEPPKLDPRYMERIE